jgi:TetR/AcrR family transcriptional regulator, regulator of autoinduction and epiphytic fitness
VPRKSDEPTEGPDTDRHAVDGRSARRDRNRLAVIDAAIELFAEGNLRPDSNSIAQRCGLSPKSVSRYFDDLDALIASAAARQMELVFPLYQIHAIGQGPLAHRVDDFVRVRLEAYEAMAATFRAASLLALSQPRVQKHLIDAESLARKQIEAHFATELEVLPPPQRQSRVAAIDALMQSETLDYYRVHRRFSLGLTRSMLVDALGGLLEPLQQLEPQRKRSRSTVPPSTRRRVAVSRNA